MYLEIVDHIILLVNAFIDNTVIVIRQRRDLFITFLSLTGQARWYTEQLIIRGTRLKVNEGVNIIHLMYRTTRITNIIRTCTVYYYLDRQHIRIVAPVALSEVVVNSVTDIAIITDITRLPLMTWDTSCHMYPQIYIIFIKFCSYQTLKTVMLLQHGQYHFQIVHQKDAGLIVKILQPVGLQNNFYYHLLMSLCVTLPAYCNPPVWYSLQMQNMNQCDHDY